MKDRPGSGLNWVDCRLYDNHHDGVMAQLFKASGAEEQAILIEENPALYYRPVYFRPSGWVRIRLDTCDIDQGTSKAGWRSWRASEPKRLAGMMSF